MNEGKLLKLIYVSYRSKMECSFKILPLAHNNSVNENDNLILLDLNQTTL